MRLRFPTTARGRIARRISAVSAVALVGALALAGCSGSGSTGGSATTSVWGLTADQKTVLQPSFDAWNKAHPDQQLKATYFGPDDYKTKIKTAVGAGSAPDIIYSWAGGTLDQYVKAGKVADLTKDIGSARDKYLDGVFGQGVIDGKVYAVPMNAVTPVLMYYNKDVFTKAGVQPPTTWSELLAVIPELKAAGVAPFALGGLEKWPELMWEEYLVDRIGGPGAFNAVMAGKADSWSNAAFIKANGMIQDLVKAGAFEDGFSSVSANSSQDVALVYTGKAAMLLQGAWVYPVFSQQSADFTKNGLGFMPFPAVDGGKGDPADVAGNPSSYFSISSKATAAQKKTALAYLKNGLFDSTMVDSFVKEGQVPPVKGLEGKLGSGTDFTSWVYDLSQKAPNFQMSWDQALSPAQATALLTNLDQLFGMQITPKQFSDNMNKTIGQ